MIQFKQWKKIKKNIKLTQIFLGRAVYLKLSFIFSSYLYLAETCLNWSKS